MQESFLGNLGLGLTTMAIGLFVVFLGLAILIGMIYVMTTVTSRKKKEAEEKTAAPVTADNTAEAESGDETDESVIAAITAALAVVMEDREQGFIVRRVRRISPPAWQSTARNEQTRWF